MNYSFEAGIGNVAETIGRHRGLVAQLPVIDEEPDPRRIRIGLAFLAVVVAVSLVMAFVIEPAIGKLVMIGIAIFTVARTFSLVRSLRKTS